MTAHDTTAPAPPAPGGTRGVATLTGLLTAMRPRQWVKNVLVLAAPFAAGRWFDLPVLAGAALAFGVFCLAASGVYLVNDTADVDADRAHPTKRRRPIAAGVVGPRTALAVAGLLLTSALAVAALAGRDLLVVVAVYVVVQLAYCRWLKHEPVIDVCVVSSGFLMRAIAGAAAAGLAVSPWFLVTTGFGSLFMATGKRYAEMRLAESTGTAIRASLRRYSVSYLRFVWSLAATVAIVAYGAWALGIGRDAGAGSSAWAAVSIVPFVVAVLRYAVDVDGGEGGEPEEIVLGDRTLQALGLAWVVALGVAVAS